MLELTEMKRGGTINKMDIDRTCAEIVKLLNDELNRLHTLLSVGESVYEKVYARGKIDELYPYVKRYLEYV